MIGESDDNRSHLNLFNIYIFELLSIDVKIDDDNRVMIFLYSLPKSYDILVITLFFEKTTLTMDKVSIVLLETNNMIKSTILTCENALLSEKIQVQVHRVKERTCIERWILVDMRIVLYLV